MVDPKENAVNGLRAREHPWVAHHRYLQELLLNRRSMVNVVRAKYLRERVRRGKLRIAIIRQRTFVTAYRIRCYVYLRLAPRPRELDLRFEAFPQGSSTGYN